jgi:glutamine amidotransferase
MGNLGSIGNMLKKVGARFKLSTSPEDLCDVSKIILPGVGSFDKGISNLTEKGYFEVITKKVVVDKIPILGICLGMQLLTNGSEEGKKPGFGFIDAFAYKFKINNNSNLKIPHMGWNTICFKKNSMLINDLIEKYRFYFVHSYAIQCNSKEDVLATTNYGCEFVSMFEHNNIIGVQFHPEKSHKFGMDLFKRFVELV